MERNMDSTDGPSVGARVLRYIGLPENYQPSPDAQPIEFLTKHLRELPPHLLTLFTSCTTPKERSIIPGIRNRRLKYTQSNPPEFSFSSAKTSWPLLWTGTERRGVSEAEEEREWVKNEFLANLQPHVGKLGELLGGYEEEREAERVRDLRRHQAEYFESLPEEDEESDEEDEESVAAEDTENAVDAEEWFLRRIKERFIYGLLEVCDIRLSRGTTTSFKANAL